MRDTPRAVLSRPIDRHDRISWINAKQTVRYDSKIWRDANRDEVYARIIVIHSASSTPTPRRATPTKELLTLSGTPGVAFCCGFCARPAILLPLGGATLAHRPVEGIAAASRRGPHVTDTQLPFHRRCAVATRSNQRQLAEILGLSLRTVSRWVAGHSPGPLLPRQYEALARAAHPRSRSSRPPRPTPSCALPPTCATFHPARSAPSSPPPSPAPTSWASRPRLWPRPSRGTSPRPPPSSPDGRRARGRRPTSRQSIQIPPRHPGLRRKRRPNRCIRLPTAPNSEPGRPSSMFRL